MNSTYFMLSCKDNVTIYVKYLPQCLVQNKHEIKVRHYYYYPAPTPFYLQSLPISPIRIGLFYPYILTSLWALPLSIFLCVPGY